MRFHRSFLFLLLGVALVVGLAVNTYPIPGPAPMTMGVRIPKGAPILPTSVERAEPPVLKFSEFNPREWLEQTHTWQNQHKPRQVTNWFIVNYQELTWRVDWDAERRPFTGFVIHHSAGNPLLMVDSLSTIGKERVYEPRYTKPWAQSYGDPLVWGLPVHSGHRFAGQEETFATYHYL